MTATLEQAGTPLATIYRGSGRLTGDVVGEDVPTNDLDRSSNYRRVGGMTREEFDVQFLREEHAQVHNGQFSHSDCPECVAVGWAS